jgi:GPH family glycoside/pentoside/hexuronide:cation symporter
VSQIPEPSTSAAPAPQQAPAPAPARRLGTVASLLIALGNLGFTAVIAATGFFLLFFYTDVALVPPALASTALLAGKLWDTVNDPLMGWISDRTRSRFGRRRVFLLFGAVPFALATACLWVMPSGLNPLQQFLWILISYTLFDTLFTLTQVAYSALAAEAATDYDDRTRLMAFSGVGGVSGYLIGNGVMQFATGEAVSAREGYALGGALLGAIAGLCVAMVGWRARDDVPVACSRPPSDRPEARRGAWSKVRVVLTNRPFLQLLAGFGLARLSFTLLQTVLAYFVAYPLQGKHHLSTMLAVLMLAIGTCIFLWKRLSERWSKSAAYALGLGFAAVPIGATFLLRPGDDTWALVLFGWAGVGLSAHWVLPWAMLPDVIELDESLSGERRAGLYFGLYGLTDKLARTLGIAAVGWVLAASGYVANTPQTPLALLGIRLLFGPLPAALLLAAVPFLLVFPLSREALARVRSHGPSTLYDGESSGLTVLLVRLFFTRFRVPRDVVRHGLRRHRDRIAVISERGALSYAQLESRVLRLAQALHFAGVRAQDRMFTQVRDGWEQVELRLAAYEVGAVLTSLHHAQPAASVVELARVAEPKVYVYDPGPCAAVAEGLARALPAVRLIDVGVASTYERELERHPPRRSGEPVRPDDLAGLGFTSGTTGTPKALAVTQRTLITSLRLTALNVRVHSRRPDTMLQCIPLCGAGSGVVLPMLLTGGTLVIPERSTPEEFIRLIQRYGVTRAFMTPSQLIDLLDVPRLDITALASLRNVIYGTAPMPVPKLEEALRRFGPIFQQGYGMAEVLPPVSLLQPEDHLQAGAIAPRPVLRSSGRLVREVQVRVVDGKGRAVPTGQVGELLVKSPTQFSGYWRRADLDAEVFDGGFLRTGDYGAVDDARRLLVLDRRADAIQRGAHTIYPRLVEEQAHDFPAVKEAAVVSLGPDAPMVLYVSLRRAARGHFSGEELQALRAFLAERLEPHQRPDEVRVLDELPRSVLGKVLRRDLRVLLRGPVEEGGRQ